MGPHEGLPNTRFSLLERTEEGDEVWLIRAISQKLYRCPGCHGELLIGELRGLERVQASEARRDKLEARGKVRPKRRRRPRR